MAFIQTYEKRLRSEEWGGSKRERKEKKQKEWNMMKPLVWSLTPIVLVILNVTFGCVAFCFVTVCFLHFADMRSWASSTVSQMSLAAPAKWGKIGWKLRTKKTTASYLTCQQVVCESNITASKYDFEKLRHRNRHWIQFFLGEDKVFIVSCTTCLNVQGLGRSKISLWDFSSGLLAGWNK